MAVVRHPELSDSGCRRVQRGGHLSASVNPCMRTTHCRGSWGMSMKDAGPQSSGIRKSLGWYLLYHSSQLPLIEQAHSVRHADFRASFIQVRVTISTRWKAYIRTKDKFNMARDHLISPRPSECQELDKEQFWISTLRKSRHDILRFTEKINFLQIFFSGKKFSKTKL